MTFFSDKEERESDQHIESEDEVRADFRDSGPKKD